MRYKLVLLATAAGLLGLGTPVVLGGSVVPDVEAWLDRPLPTDVSAGSTFAFGALLWDPRSDSAVVTSVLVRVHPASGDAPPLEIAVRQDWPGHYVALLTAPPGGLGEIELITAGTACTAAGCSRADLIYAVAGTGPPPDAPLGTIATAEVAPPAERLVAGLLATLDVRLIPRAAWDAAGVPWPEELTLQVRRPREPVLAEAPARLADAATGTYRATISPPEAGTFVFQVAAPGADDPAGVVFGGSAVSLVVEPPPSAAADAGADTLPVAVLAGVAGVVLLAVLGLVLVARRAGL